MYCNKEWQDDMLAFFQLNCYILDAPTSNHTISHRKDITLPLPPIVCISQYQLALQKEQ
jgi:hypothetical protein